MLSLEHVHSQRSIARPHGCHDLLELTDCLFAQGREARHVSPTYDQHMALDQRTEGWKDHEVVGGSQEGVVAVRWHGG